MPHQRTPTWGDRVDASVTELVGRLPRDPLGLAAAVDFIELIAARPEEHLAALRAEPTGSRTWLRLLSLVDLALSRLPGAVDSGTPDSGAADAEPSDAADLDAGTPCDYLDLNVCIVQCAGYEYARQFVDLNGVCPEYYRLNGNDYPDIRTAIATEMCNPNCIYKAFQSVSFIDHCNRRNGYIVFRAPGAGCADLYEFSNGLFASPADWEAATPCGP